MKNDLVSTSVEEAILCGLSEPDLVQAMRAIDCHEADIDAAKRELRAARSGGNVRPKAEAPPGLTPAG